MPELAGFAEYAPCGLVVTSTDGSIQWANATFCSWLGRDAQALTHNRLQDLLTVGGRVFHQTHCAPLLEMQGSVAEVKLELRHADGHRVPMLLNAMVQEHAGRRWHHLAFMVVHDRHQYERELLLARQRAEEAVKAYADAQESLHKHRDQLRRANEQLSQADQRKDEFLATLAHELRNPLAPMRTAVEILKLKPNPDTQARSSIAIIDRQLHHMSHLVDDLLEVSRIAQGKLELRRSIFELASALGDAVEAAQPAILAGAHALSVSLPPEPIHLDADRTRVVQIVLNLLNNAAKYTPRGGNIFLTAKQADEHAVISVRDTGIGIAKESLATIFEMFSQLAPGLERAQGGLGIGLSLVRGLVELHDGTISAASDGVGHGSEFTVRLPTTAALSAPERLKRGPDSARRRILVVDDNEDAAASLALLLELQGHQVFMAHDGHSALRVTEESRPEVVLLDIGLPGLDGYEVARRMRLAPWGEHVTLIALTGWAQQRDRQQAMQAGFDEHLTKPIDPVQLGSFLANLTRYRCE